MPNSKIVPTVPNYLIDLNENGRKIAANDNLAPQSILSEGSRNNRLTGMAGYLRRTQNLDEGGLFHALWALNQTAESPLGQNEVRGIAKSVSGYAGGQLPAFQDIPLSRHIAASIGNNCRYVPEWGWVAWDGHRWVPDMGGIKTREFIKRQLEAIYEGVRSQGEPESTNKARSLLASSKVAAMLAMAQSDDCLQAASSEFDAIDDIVNLQNGTFDLRTMDLDPHRPEDLLSKVANAKYDPNAECPHFDALLESTLPLEHQRFVLRLFGYALQGKPLAQVFAIFTGKGANGKSTLLNAVANALGDYSTNVEPSSFIRQKSERVRNDVARLKGARLVGTSELAVGEVLDAALVKRFTGGDTITARALFKEYFEFQPEFVVFMTTNALPVIDGGDQALGRRLIIVPFSSVILEEKRDLELPQKLRDEASGILNRLLEGLDEYQEKGLAVPEDIKMEAARFCVSSDMLGTFLEEKCELGPQYTVGASEIYRRYKSWNEANGLRPLSQPQFRQELVKKLGASSKKTKTGVLWPGLRLRLAVSH